jgi:hypothetical protein
MPRTTAKRFLRPPPQGSPCTQGEPKPSGSPREAGGTLRRGGESDPDTDNDHPVLRYAGMLSDLTPEQLQAFDEILKERLSFR